MRRVAVKQLKKWNKISVGWDEKDIQRSPRSIFCWLERKLVANTPVTAYTVCCQDDFINNLRQTERKTSEHYASLMQRSAGKFYSGGGGTFATDCL